MSDEETKTDISQWSAVERAADAMASFDALVFQGKGVPLDESEVNSAQGLAMQIHAQLVTWFTNTDSPGLVAVATLQAMWAAGVEARATMQRAIALVAVHRWSHGARSPDTRNDLIDTLASIDEAFEELRTSSSEVDDILAKFDTSPRGKRGSRGTESTLAELILLAAGYTSSTSVLGFDAGDTFDRLDGAEHLRKALFKPLVREKFEELSTQDR